MVEPLAPLRELTNVVALPGGQARLCEAILYVCSKCADAKSFGLVKLNKILWLADFSSFAERGQPVTGRRYQRLPFGPAPVEMLPLLQEMERDGRISVSPDEGRAFEERRPRVNGAPRPIYLTAGDLGFLDRAVAVFWNDTARAASDRSHGVAWKTRLDGDPMPYELAYLSDEPIGAGTLAKLQRLGRERGWRSS